MNRFTFVDCATVDEALSQMKGDAVVKAGGIDLLDLMKDGVVSPPKLVSILNVQSLHRIESSDRGLHLGPLTTLHEIAEHPEIQRTRLIAFRFPAHTTHHAEGAGTMLDSTESVV